MAEALDAPYRPTQVGSVGNLSASVFVCDDRRSWHRNDAHDAMMLVLEGVLILDSRGARAVANEGEFITVPRKVDHNLSAGMRSTVILFQEQQGEGASNGHMPLPQMPTGSIDKINAAVEVLQGQPFEWLPIGGAGGCSSVASRLWGDSAPYTTAEQTLLLVYRGVLDYEAGEDSGTVVGSQMVLLPAGTSLRFHSERGATVLMVARKGSELPQAAAPAGGGAAG